MNKKYCKTLELDKILTMLSKNCCCKESAERCLEIEPVSDYNSVMNLLEQTADAHMFIGRFGAPSFGAISNVTNALRRAQAGSVLTMGELLSIASTLRGIRMLREWRSHSEGVTSCLDGMFMSLVANKYLEEKIDTSIVSEEEMADNASAELSNIRRKIRSSQSSVREKLDKLIRSQTYQKYLQDSIVTMRNGRFVVPVKSEHRSEIPGLVHDTSSSGATVFVEPMAVVETNNEIKVLLSSEKAEIDRILTALSQEAGSYADSISASYHVAIELDMIFARAQLGYSMKAVIPKVNNLGKINLKKARHPLIDPKSVVPLDIRLGIDFDTLVITGPNTGGKTVTLKTIGLFTLMTMCGMMIPATESSEVSVFENVLVDIGDEQSIEQSLSTFSAHMTNIRYITGQANQNSLILLDELGAGTDPAEGAALAMSILEFLHEKGAKIASTTHYSELKSYAINTHGVENGCCEFDVATLRPTYKLLIGIPGKSNAFAISERLGIPAEIIENSKKMLSAESRSFEETISKLEEYRQEMETQKAELDKLKLDAQNARAEADSIRKRLQKDKDNELELARGEAKRIIENARQQVQQTLDEVEEIRKQKANSDFSSRAAKAKADLKGKLRKLEDSADPVNMRSNEGYKLPRPIEVGDTVLIYDIDKTGMVTKILDNGKAFEVQAGIIKMKVSVSNLRLMKQEKVKTPVSGVRTVKGSQRELSTEIDIRGQNVEEAILEVDSFIDNAVLCGIQTITIIHGKGTGALRAGIHQHLKRHRNIRTFRLGVYGEGENGVTICEIK